VLFVTLFNLGHSKESDFSRGWLFPGDRAVQLKHVGCLTALAKLPQVHAPHSEPQRHDQYCPSRDRATHHGLCRSPGRKCMNYAKDVTSNNPSPPKTQRIMDDLSGLDWSSSAQPNASKLTPAASYAALRPTPSPFTSGRNTPLSSQASGAQFSKPGASKPAQDSFSNLVNFGAAAKPPAKLSLREQQERLEAERRKKDDDLRRQAQASFGGGQFLDNLGSGNVSRTASPAVPSGLGTAPVRNGTRDASDDDLFAAFNKDTEVDNASYYPPPRVQSAASGKASPAPVPAPNLNLRDPGAWDNPLAKNSNVIEDDDDPFGLGQLKASKAAAAVPMSRDQEDDDLLGDLGKPVDQVRRKPSPTAPEPGKPIESPESDSESAGEAPRQSNDPFDKAVAQLVDYGFTPENARRGLTESGAGLNVQAAVNWLLDDAHRQSKEQSKARNGSQGSDERASSRRQNESPAWQADPPNRSANRSPAVSEGDFSKTASAVGSTLLKSANSLWKTGQKKVQKAVADFQQDTTSDPSQPKWMRDAQSEQGMTRQPRKAIPDVTDEAMMLESGGRPERRQARSQPEATPSSKPPLRTASPASALPPTRGAVPKWQQTTDPKSRLSKQAIEEQSSTAYVSPARRRRPQQAESKPAARETTAEPDLLFSDNSAAAPTSGPFRRPSPATSAPARPRPPPQKARPQRRIPHLSPVALQASTKHRLEGTAQFKRGDYAAAHASYTSSISVLPQEHPLIILLLTNRALTSLKTGEPRQAVADADTAVTLIGEGKGEGEHVDLGVDNERRDMRELYGKALTRKAEALEQMEKWADAAAAWQACVESGVGGPTAIAGRQRSQNALAPKPKAPTPRPATRRAPAVARPQPSPAAAANGGSSEAVQRLRAANKAADREGAEKIALIDGVDARIAAWREGKRDNLRALLGSLENVLWEGSGWKKVGLHELVMANKVKIVYMKAIGKTHPDKVSSSPV
jgi:hypothetical protein